MVHEIKHSIDRKPLIEKDINKLELKEFPTTDLPRSSPVPSTSSLNSQVEVLAETQVLDKVFRSLIDNKRKGTLERTSGDTGGFRNPFKMMRRSLDRRTKDNASTKTVDSDVNTQ